jgi:two-component system, LytTR family, response regulator
MKAVIIDDEQDSREVLAGYLGKYCPDVTVCGFGESVSTGLEAIRKYDPDIVFLDIEMPYGNGFDLLDQAGDVTFDSTCSIRQAMSHSKRCLSRPSGTTRFRR